MYMIKNSKLVKIQKHVLKILIVTLVVFVISNCTRSYDILFINYNKYPVYVSDDLTQKENVKKVNPNEFIVIKRGFMSGIGDLTYFVLDNYDEVLLELKFQHETLHEQYFIYKDELIIIKVK